MEIQRDLTLADIGEFGFIEILRSRFGRSDLTSDVVIGIGDDVAVIDYKGSEYLLATCDVQISDIHFPLDLIPPYDLGCRVVEVNASDIAAKGGSPKWALVGLNVPSRTSLKFLEELYSGINDALIRVGASLVGGNCARTKKEIVIDLFLIGTVSKTHLVKRKGAKVGDVIFVTGTLGRARAGLEVVLGNREKMVELDENTLKLARQFFFRPVARVQEGQILAGSGYVTSMIDVSDGFLQDLGHIARENRLNAVVELSRIPVDSLCRKIAKHIGSDPLLWALSGGEDYELLFTVRENYVRDFLKHYENVEIGSYQKAGLTPVGRFEEGSGEIFVLDYRGNYIPASDFISSGGWDHFGSKRHGQS